MIFKKIPNKIIVEKKNQKQKELNCIEKKTKQKEHQNKIIDENKIINMIKSPVNRLEENVCCEYIFIVMITNKTLFIENIEKKRSVALFTKFLFMMIPERRDEINSMFVVEE